MLYPGCFQYFTVNSSAWKEPCTLFYIYTIIFFLKVNSCMKNCYTNGIQILSLLIIMDKHFTRSHIKLHQHWHSMGKSTFSQSYQLWVVTHFMVRQLFNMLTHHLHFSFVNLFACHLNIFQLGTLFLFDFEELFICLLLWNISNKV